MPKRSEQMSWSQKVVSDFRHSIRSFLVESLKHRTLSIGRQTFCIHSHIGPCLFLYTSEILLNDGRHVSEMANIIEWSYLSAELRTKFNKLGELCEFQSRLCPVLWYLANHEFVFLRHNVLRHNVVKTNELNFQFVSKTFGWWIFFWKSKDCIREICAMQIALFLCAFR